MQNVPLDLELRSKLKGSLLLFTQTFFRILNSRDFELSHPVSRESHFITICKELTLVKDMQTSRLIINVPPGHGKSTLLTYFVAWCLAQYPDSQFLYISYSKTLAAKHTAIIKTIMSFPAYREIFGVEIRKDSNAKDAFQTLQGGSVRAFGSAGSITGQDAGLPNLERFSGAVIMDDMHKPDEVHSDGVREGVINNYKQTVKPRLRGPNVPMIFIGQRLHEADLPAHLLSGEDGYPWKKVILEAVDKAGNILYPEVTSQFMIDNAATKNIYVFSSQYQQNPQPAGGGIFKKNWFCLVDEEPEMLATFITCDTAETSKSYNDATVFSFFGLYEIETLGHKTGQYALHWIDCIELRVEPKDLEGEFSSFYSQCLSYPVQPKMVAIEKKSTGVTLLSILSEMRGLDVIEVARTRSSGSKTDRFLELQPLVAARMVSFPARGKHVQMCIDHVSKITANNTHRHDDIMDTLYDGCKIALIDKTLYCTKAENKERSDMVKNMNARFKHTMRLKQRAHRSL